MSAQKLITEHLDLWTGAIARKSSSGRASNGKIELTGINKLRKLILELAVRGSLVDQDPSDESAQERLERCLKAKAVSVELGKLKKARKHAAITSDATPFGLPQGWVWSRLDDLVRVINGRAYKKHEMLSSGTLLLRVGNLFTSNDWYYSDLELEEDKYIDSGDLIYAWSASFGPFIWDGGRAIYHYHIWKLDLFDEAAINKRFLYLYLKAVTKEIKSSGSGIAMVHMTKAKMEELVVPVPPLEEQHRIVQKVDELMALCDRLEQQTSDQLEAHETLVDTLLGTLTQSENATDLADNWARLAAHFDILFTTEQSIDKLKQTILQLMATGMLVTFSAKAQPLKNLISFGPRNGYSPKESDIDTGYRVLKLGATTKGQLNLEESKIVEIDDTAASHLWLRKGDILIQRGNSADHVGCNVLIDNDHPHYIYPDLMMKVRANGTVFPRFLSLYLSAPESRRFMWDRMTGTSGTMPKISKKVVEAVPVSAPDIKAQKAAVRKVDELFTLCDQLKARLNQASETRCQLADAIVEGALH